MIYVFEGPRNSGKTFLSEHISKNCCIPRFQFLFSEYIEKLGLTSQNSKETHAFAMGKELMIMQLFKDLDIRKDIIHDRGILSVLAWGLLENRITESQMESQVQLVKNLGLMDGISVIFITGNNQNKDARNKDQWDKFDGDPGEFECYERVIRKFELNGISNITRFTNNFDLESTLNFEILFRDLLLK